MLNLCKKISILFIILMCILSISAKATDIDMYLNTDGSDTSTTVDNTTGTDQSTSTDSDTTYLSPQVSTSYSDSEGGLGLTNILNILLIVIGVLLILLAIAIIIRLKSL